MGSALLPRPRDSVAETLADDVAILDVTYAERHGLPCPTCREQHRFEMDVIHAGTVIITLQGCPTCSTGLCDDLA
jgi:hypothetical protein